MHCSVLILFYFLTFCSGVLSDCSNVVVISDFDPKSCDRGKNEIYSESVGDSCLPGCVIKAGRGEYCTEDHDCQPGLKCETTALDQCVDDPSKEERCFFQNPTLSWTPNCLPDGSFAPVQCKGESLNGRCYCYSRAGIRIFGEEWSSKAEDMTCACSRQRSELEKQGRTDVTLHCDSLGNFEPLQCDSGSCWCSDPKSGDVVAAVVPEEMMTILPCYNKTLIGGQYLRQCESQLLALNKMKFEFSTHGTNNIKLPYLQCDYDGGYGRLKVSKGQVYCSWRDNTNILSYATQQNQMKLANCYCARDHKIYELSGRELTKTCAGNGNYELVQPFDDKTSYCVDLDGFLTYGPVEDLTQDICVKYLP